MSAVLHQSYGLGMTGLKVYFRGNDHVWATIGYQEAFSYSLRHPFQSPYFVDLLTNFRFQRRGMN
jgi:hypothetical protein